MSRWREAEASPWRLAVEMNRIAPASKLRPPDQILVGLEFGARRLASARGSASRWRTRFFACARSRSRGIAQRRAGRIVHVVEDESSRRDQSQSGHDRGKMSSAPAGTTRLPAAPNDRVPLGIRKPLPASGGISKIVDDDRCR